MSAFEELELKDWDERLEIEKILLTVVQRGYITQEGGELGAAELAAMQKVINSVDDFRKSLPKHAWHTMTITASQVLPMFRALKVAQQERAADAPIYCQVCGDEILPICGDCNGEN